MGYFKKSNQYLHTKGISPRAGYSSYRTKSTLQWVEHKISIIFDSLNCMNGYYQEMLYILTAGQEK